MVKKITIAIDAMGGENSPDKTVEGIGIFLNRPIAIAFFVVGLLVLFFRIKTKDKSLEN